MYVKTLGLAVACLAWAALMNVADAQSNTGPRATYGSCMSQAAAEGIVGDDLSRFVDACVRRPATVSTAPTFKSCRNDAVSRNIRGDTLDSFLDACMASSGASAASMTGASYGECNSRAVSQGIVGDALSRFMDGCVGR
jgi:hypothetical protein